VENKQEASAFKFWKFLGKGIALYLRDEVVNYFWFSFQEFSLAPAKILL
jgi:hypothetical protein